MDDDEASDLFDYLVVKVVMPPGRWVLEQFGVRRASERDIASIITGMAFWAFAVFLVFALVLGW